VNFTLRQQISDKKLKVLRCPAGHLKDSPFLPLHVDGLMPNERITFDLFVKVRQKEGNSITFLPYWKKGETLQADGLEALEGLGIERLYVDIQSLDHVLAYLNNILCLQDNEGEPTPEKLTLLREHLHLSLYRAFSAPSLGRHIHLAEKTLNRFLGYLQRKPNAWQLVGQILYHDYTLYSHSVNVSLLGLAVMVFLRKTGRESLIMGLAGLFHDLGMTRIKVELMYKTDSLTEAEKEVFRKHPCYSYQMLKSNAAFPVEALRLVLEHHENADGSGYPQGLLLSQQHPFTRVLRALDSYDALTCPRPYRSAFKPFAALKIMQEERGAAGLVFDPAVLKKLIHFLAIT